MEAERILQELERAGYRMGAAAYRLRIPEGEVRALGEQSGPPELRRFLVAVRPKLGQWSRLDDQAIRKARRDYNAGLVEIHQKTIEEWTYMYAIPRQEPCPARDYFPKEML